MYMPYGNVVRMHLMILLFGFLSAATDLQGYALYIVLIFYFFRSRRYGMHFGARTAYENNSLSNRFE